MTDGGGSEIHERSSETNDHEDYNESKSVLTVTGITISKRSVRYRKRGSHQHHADKPRGEEIEKSETFLSGREQNETAGGTK